MQMVQQQPLVARQIFARLVHPPKRQITGVSLIEDLLRLSQFLFERFQSELGFVG